MGETLYIFDDLLKRNIVTCVICPKINIIQIDLACRRNFTVIQVLIFVLYQQVKNMVIVMLLHIDAACIY